VEEIEEKGDWAYAAKVLEYLWEHYDNELWMKTRCANALYHTGQYDDAARLAGDLNGRRPTVSTLLIEARARCKKEDFCGAIDLLKKAEEILNGSELAWTL
jgi:Flp pilus assembly protein TadD